MSYCLEKDALLQEYLASTCRFFHIATELREKKGEERRAALTESERAHHDCERARLALWKHREDHGC